MAFTIFTQGTKAKASEVNADFNTPLRYNAINHADNVMLSSADIDEDAHLIYGNSETFLDTANTEAVISANTGSIIAGGAIYDNIDDSSIDSNLWTQAGDYSCIEGTDSINLTTSGSSGGDHNLTTDGSSGNLNMNSGTTYVLFDLHINASGAGPVEKRARIQITNTSTTINIFSHISTDPATDVTRRAYLLKVDASADLANIWHHTATGTWTQIGTNIDISTVTTNKYLRFIVERASAEANQIEMNIHKVCSYTADVSGTITTTNKTLSESKNNVFVHWKQIKNGSTDATGTATLDNGTDYDAVALDTATKLTNAGTQIGFTVDLATNGDETPDEIEYIIGLGM